MAEVGANVAELLDELVSSDFLGVDTSGRQFDKAHWVVSYKEIAFDPALRESWTTALREYSNQDLSIRMYGTAAVVAGWRQRGQGGHRFVHVWKLQQGQWKLVISQSTLTFPYPNLLTNRNPDSTKR